MEGIGKSRLAITRFGSVGNKQDVMAYNTSG